MLDVFVCEDSATQRRKIVKIIENTILMEELDMRLVLDTENPSDLLREVMNSRHTGIYFLDIDLNSGMNGIQLAREIRKYDPRGFIVFITVHSEMCFMTFQYRVEAMDFVLKDNPAEAKVKIIECLLNSMERYSLQSGKTRNVYTLETGGRKISVDCDEILFFETSSNIHKVILHAKERQIEFTGTLKELEDSLGEDFLRCHRSYLVNRKNIEEVDSRKMIIHFINGESCPGSRRKIKGL